MPRPTPLGPERRHLMLLHRMARATGIDPAEMSRRGHLTQEDWSGAVTRCRGCQIVPDCERFLERRADGPRPAPQACRNATLLERLGTA